MKTFLKIYISLSIILSPIFFINLANAAAMDGWTLSDFAPAGSSTTASGTKPVTIDGKQYIKRGKAKITPNVSQVSKVLKGGIAGAALSFAVEQLLGVVDWVLDAANNQIVYTPRLDPQRPDLRYVYSYNIGDINRRRYQTAEAACNKPELISIYPSWQIFINRGLVFTNGQCVIDPTGLNVTSTAPRVLNPAYNPNAIEEEKTLALDVVSAQVISNAEANDANAQVATTAASQDIINDAKQDEAKARPIVQQLEASASTENADSAAQEAANQAQGQIKPNAANPNATDLKLSFPVFCGWAPVVCEAAQVAIQFPARVQTWVNQGLAVGEKIQTEQKATTAEAAKTATATQAINQELTNSNDLPQKDTSAVVLPDVPIVPQTVQVNWGNACPSPTTATLAMFGQSTEITLINYDPICQWAWVVEYSVIALASISSVFIVAGRKS